MPLAVAGATGGARRARAAARARREREQERRANGRIGGMHAAYRGTVALYAAPACRTPRPNPTFPHVVAAARAAQPAWAALSVEERVKRIAPLKTACSTQAENIAKVVCEEVGKPEVEALLGEALPSADVVAYWTSNIVEMLDPDEVDIDSFAYPGKEGDDRARAARRRGRDHAVELPVRAAAAHDRARRSSRATRSSSSRAR